MSSEYLGVGLLVLPAFGAGVLVGVAVAVPDYFPIQQRACFGDVTRLQGDTLTVVRLHPECLKIFYPAEKRR